MSNTERQHYNEVKMKVGVSNIPADVSEFINHLMEQNESLQTRISPENAREASKKQMKFRSALYREVIPMLGAMWIVTPPSLNAARMEISMLVSLRDSLKEMGYDSGEWDIDDYDDENLTGLDESDLF